MDRWNDPNLPHTVVTDHEGTEYRLIDSDRLTDEQRQRLQIAYAPQQAAMLLGVTEADLDAMHEAGEIAVIQVDDERIVPRTEIDRIRAKRGESPI